MKSGKSQRSNQYRKQASRTRNRATNSVRGLSFESLETRDLLTTLLVNFTGGGGGVAPVTAADFAAADPNVDLSAPINTFGSGGATGLPGTDGAVFDVVDGGNAQWTTNKGTYVDQPILDAYIFVNNGVRTVTVSDLEEIATGELVTVTLYGVGDATNQEAIFTLDYNGAEVGTDETDYDSGDLADTYVQFSFNKVAGVDAFDVSFQNSGNGAATGAFNGFSVTTQSSTVRINAGGDAHVDSEGNEFLADQFFTTPSQTFDVIGTDIFIPGTGGTTANDEDVDDILYQTERFGTDFGYEIPVANGFYTLRLHYAEIFQDDVGERIFDVTAEGQLISDDLDIFEARQNAFTPGNFAALIQEFSLIEVTDGGFSINFNAEAPDGVDNAKISAIEILPVESPQLVVSQTGNGTTVVEGGETDTYDLSLTVAPTEDVTVTITTGTEVTADVTQLVFTPGNFDVPQTVTLTAVDDTAQDGTLTVSVTHALSSLDQLYDGISSQPLSVVVVDDDSVVVDFDQRTIATGISNPTTGAFGPDGRLYVATQGGQIRAYTLDGNNNVTDTQIINSISSQSGFRNVLGIAFDPFEEVGPGETPTIYVTRSSLFDGTEEYGSRVSTLTGPTFGTVNDIITGLPVSGFDHGINGIQFDGNGDLLIAVGGNTNTGVFDGVFGSQAPESPLTSAVLRAPISDPTFNGAIQYEFIDPNDPDLLALAASENDPSPSPNDQRYGNFVQPVDVPGQADVETFAVGLRNPYDIVFTTDGQLFSTDNGPNGIAQDELNQIAEGDFLGHPSIPRGKLDPRQVLANAEYDPNVPSDPPNYRAPLDALSSSTNGIDEYRSEAFGGQLRGQLFAQKWNGFVYFFERTPDGLGLQNTNTRNDVADGLDIVAGPRGAIFGIDRNENRITIAEPVDLTVTDPTAYDIFPFRAPAIGGNQFTIGGENFGTLGNTTVTIGGVAATLTSVEDGKIVGVLPAVPGVDFTDVVVTSAGVTSTLTDAFLPLNGSPIVDSADFDGDLDVDGSDFLAWQRGFGTNAGAMPSDGDANGDGAVNSADLAVWTTQYSTSGSLASIASEVPASASAAAVASSSENEVAIDSVLTGNWFEESDEEDEPNTAESVLPFESSIAGAATSNSGTFFEPDDSPENDQAASASGDERSADPWLDDELLERVFG